jgi:synaptotagmin-like protein
MCILILFIQCEQSSRESLASVYSDAGDVNYSRVPVSGDITFGLEYDHKISALRINVKNCQNLSPADSKHNWSNP